MRHDNNVPLEKKMLDTHMYKTFASKDGAILNKLHWLKKITAAAFKSFKQEFKIFLYSTRKIKSKNEII